MTKGTSLKEKKALTWDQFKYEIKNNGRKEDEFKLSTRYTAVFNAHDVEGMPEISVPQNTDVSVDDLVTILSKNMHVQIFNDGGDRAFYSPHEDMIHLPTPQSFNSEYAYNATALHELSHSIGHPTRLNRPQGGFFGSEQYAYEELVAEMCSCFMGVELSALSLTTWKLLWSFAMPCVIIVNNCKELNYALCRCVKTVFGQNGLYCKRAVRCFGYICFCPQQIPFREEDSRTETG